jgi:predicted DNA-binding transcriptional regulator YafY
MPATKAQSLRLEILDEMLDARKWKFQELLDRLNQKLELDYEPIGKRTLLRDLDFLVDVKNAPLHRPTKNDQYYYYTEKFSLKNIPFDADDIANLKNAIHILKQVGDFSLLHEVEYVIRKLENRVNVEAKDEQVYIQFERHTSAQGTEYISELLEAIKNKNPLKISYQPYSHPQPSDRIVHPYLLKEFRNRWFLLGREGSANRITNYALDRIKKIKPAPDKFIDNDFFDPNEYFKYLIGVSVPENAKPEKIEIKVYRQAVPYILSKPIHTNQEMIDTLKDGSMLIRLMLIVNYELRSILLSYGDGIEVRKPKGLKAEIKRLTSNMQNLYH